MSRLFRTLCVSLCAALVAVLSLHGVQDSRHQIAHAADWPAMAIGHEDHAETVDIEHGSPHVQVAPEATSYDPLDQAEKIEGDGGGGRPASHHHHSGSDAHTAIPILGRDLTPLVASDAVLFKPAVDDARPAHDNDGPEYPPRRMRTII